MNVKNLAIIMLTLVPTAHALTALTDAQMLINHVEESIAKADRKVSKINNEILAIDGMSSPKVRHFLNNLCSLPGANYLEIGVWKGSTFVAALYGNTEILKSSIAIDNWSEFGGPRMLWNQNCRAFLPDNSFQFYDVNSFALDKRKIFKNPINIYFYDGNHSVESQKRAFTYYNDVFAEVFIAVIDDWNQIEVKMGTDQAFKELGYTVLYERMLPGDLRGGDIVNWWCGLYVAVIRKG